MSHFATSSIVLQFIQLQVVTYYTCLIDLTQTNMLATPLTFVLISSQGDSSREYHHSYWSLLHYILDRNSILLEILQILSGSANPDKFL